MSETDAGPFDFVTTWAAESRAGEGRGGQGASSSAPSRLNQDAHVARPELGLFALADGMGGHAAGEIAAALCLEALVSALAAPEARTAALDYGRAPTLAARRRVFGVLRAAADRANERVRAHAETLADPRGMGATLDAVLLVRDRAFVLHVGDARAYLARPEALIQLTHDHDFRALMVAHGRLSLSRSASVHNQLLNAIGRSRLLYADVLLVGLAPGDRLVLCTDGVHACIGDESVLAGLVRSGAPSSVAAALVSGAAARGGRDDATAIVVDVGAPVRAREGDDDHGLAASDLAVSRACPLLVGLPDGIVLRALAMGVEVEVDAGDPLPRMVTTDRVAYVLLEGEAETQDGLHGPLRVGASALLYPESLLGMEPKRGTSGEGRFVAAAPVRALRLRGDDFRELCGSDARLAAALYERLARHLCGRR